MADKNSAGLLHSKVALDKREDVDDGTGNTVSDWQEQFQTRAEFIHLRGSEAVMAGRLQGRHTQVIRVRISSNTRLITTDFRVRDTRRNIAFNIRDIEWETNRQFISLTCESGVATG